MSDIFQEVEEEVRRERFEQLWKEYGDYVVAGVALVIIAVAGFVVWQRYEANQRLKASDTLITSQQMAEAGDIGRATPGFATLATDGPGGYAEMAQLSQADALAQAARPDEAATIYKAVAAKDHGPVGKLALLRAGWALAAATPRADLETLLKPLLDPKSAWRHAAREVLAYADFHAGDAAKAQAEFKALAADTDAPPPMRSRADAMATFLANGGVRAFGTVPKPPAPAAPDAAAGTAVPPPVAPPAQTGTPQQ